MTTDDILHLCIQKKLLAKHVTHRPGLFTVWLSQRPPGQDTLYSRFSGTGLLPCGYGWHNGDGHYLWLREQWYEVGKKAA